jgi:hypothetical protein
MRTSELETIETDSHCNRCQDETPHTIVVYGRGWGYGYCDNCGTETDWNADEEGL